MKWTILILIFLLIIGTVCAISTVDVYPRADDTYFVGNTTHRFTSGIFTEWLNSTRMNSTYYGDGRNLIMSRTYYPFNISTTRGTYDDGNLTSITTMKDGLSYNSTEASGADPLRIVINFTGVTTFDNLVLRLWYVGGQGHEIEVGIWDYTTLSYEEEYGDITDTGGFVLQYFHVLDPSDHLDANGNVSVQLRHIQNGLSFHELYIDYVAVIEGFSALTANEHDGLSGRDDKENHPWAFPTDGTRNITGNVNITGDLWLGGQGNFSYINVSGCADNQILKVCGESWCCEVDATGAGGGAGLWQVAGEWMFDNGTAGGKPNINMSIANITTIYENSISLVNKYVQLGNSTIETLWADYIGGYNTTNEIFLVVDNKTFHKYEDTLTWTNLSTWDFNVAWTSLLDFGNITNLNLNSAWLNTLGGANITADTLGATQIDESNLVVQSGWINTTEQVRLAQLINTTNEVFLVVDNQTFHKYEDTMIWGNLSSWDLNVAWIGTLDWGNITNAEIYNASYDAHMTLNYSAQTDYIGNTSLLTELLSTANSTWQDYITLNYSAQTDFIGNATERTLFTNTWNISYDAQLGQNTTAQVQEAVNTSVTYNIAGLNVTDRVQSETYCMNGQYVCTVNISFNGTNLIIYG